MVFFDSLTDSRNYVGFLFDMPVVELATILSMSWLLPPANLGFFSGGLVFFSTVLAVFETLNMFEFRRDFDHLNMFIFGARLKRG